MAQKGTTQKKWHSRGFVAFLMVLSFIGIVFSGIILYIVPHGRIALWTNWKLLGLTKSQWESLHTNLGYAFLIFAIFHIYYNWKSLYSYVYRKTKHAFYLKKELATATVLTLVIIIGSAVNIPPFKTVMDIGDYFKNSWEKKLQAPPIPHMELFSLRKVVKDLNGDPDIAIKILNNRGIKVESADEKLKEIAAKNSTSPEHIYNLLKDRFSTKHVMGLGRMTFKDLVEKQGIKLSKIKKLFSKYGVEMDQNMTLREFSNRVGKTPYQIWEELQK